MTKIGFIQVPKRYQLSPITNDNKLQKDINSEINEENKAEEINKTNKKSEK